jgi:large subunit ribosomal protein L3
MIKGLLGEKVGMTQVFDPEGSRVPVSVVKVGGNVVIQKKTEDGKDGYNAIKIGFGDVKKLEKDGEEPRWRLARPEVGVFESAGIEAPRKHVREFRVYEEDLEHYEAGQELDADLFEPGEWVDVTGTSKGRGFSGVMRRHNFAGAKATHGVHEYFRHGGSIGMSADPSRVLPGMKMPGQYGNATVTTQNLRVIQVRPEDNALLIKGSIPGANGGIVLIRTATKKYQR